MVLVFLKTLLDKILTYLQTIFANFVEYIDKNNFPESFVKLHQPSEKATWVLEIAIKLLIIFLIFFLLFQK